MLNAVLTPFYFLLSLLILVIIHEFGHFWVARRFGIKVLRFSFGFGPVLWSCHDKKGTEYVFSLIPLGGYVKLLDEREGNVLPEEQALTMNRQPPWIRLLVVSAGPLFNWVLAFILFWVVLIIGVPSVAPRIAAVIPNSIASLAQIQPKSEVITIEGRQVASWRDVQYKMMSYLGTERLISWQLENNETHRPYQAMINTTHWHLEGTSDFLKSLGIIPWIPEVPSIIDQVQPDSPAARAGLQVGDDVLSIANHPVHTWFKLLEWVRKYPNQTVSLEIRRGNHIKKMKVTVGETQVEGKSSGFLGVISQPLTQLSDWMRVERMGPVDAILGAFDQTVNYTKMSFVFLGRLVTGKLSAQGMSGPVGIAIGARESARGGLVYYLSFLALVSISLAVINVLPIPLLDGGHLFYDLMELFFRFTVSDYVKSVMNRLGFVFLAGLMGFTVVNDLARLMN